MISLLSLNGQNEAFINVDVLTKDKVKVLAYKSRGELLGDCF